MCILFLFLVNRLFAVVVIIVFVIEDTSKKEKNDELLENDHS